MHVADMDDVRRKAVMKAIQRAGTGVCIACGVKVNKTSKWPRCLPCQRRKDTNLDPEKLKTRRKRHREKLKELQEEGVCSLGRCTEPVKPGRKQCVRHLEMAAKTAKRRRKAAVQKKGICNDICCSDPVQKGKKKCPRHLGMQAATARRWREKKSA